MSLFNSMSGGGSGGNMISGGGLFGQRQQQPSGGGLFGSQGGMGGGSGGNLFGGGGGQQTNLFGNAMSGNQSSQGGLFGSQSNTNRGGGIFGGGMGGGQNSGGGGIFGGGSGSMGGGSGGLFGGGGSGNMGQSQGIFGGSGAGSGGIFGGGQSSGGGMLGMLGGGQSKGTFSFNYNSNNLAKNKEGIPVASITGVQNFRGKALDELRTEDYFAQKNKQIPDNVLSQLQAQWQRNMQNPIGSMGGGSGMLGGGGFGGQQSGLGSIGGGGLFGGGSNQSQNQNQNQMGGGLFGSNQRQGGNLFGQSGGGQQAGGLLGGNKQGGGLFGGGGQQGGSLLGGSGNQMSGGGGLLGGGGSAGGLFGNKSNTGGGLLGGGGSSGGLLGGGGSGGGLLGGGGSGGGLLGGGSGSGGGLFGGNSGGGGLLGGQNKQGGGLFGGGSGGLLGGSSGQQSGGLFGGNKTGGSLLGGGSSSGGGLLGGGGSGGGGLFSGQGSGGGGLLSGGSSGGLFSGAAGQKSGGLFGGNQQAGGLLSGGQQAGAAYGDARAAQEVQQLMALAGIDMQQAQLYELLNNMRATAQSNYSLFGKTLGATQASKEMFEKYETGRDSLLSSVVKRNAKLDYNPFEKSYSQKKNYSELSSDLDTKISLRNKALSLKKKEEPISLLGRKSKTDYLDRDVPLSQEYKDACKKMMNNSNWDDKNFDKRRLAEITRGGHEEVRLLVFFNKGEEERTFSVEIKTSSTCFEIKTTILKLIFDTTYLNFNKYKLLYKNRILSDNDRVKEIGFKDNDKVYLIPDPEAAEETHENFSNGITSKDQLATEDLLPKLTKNYHTEPSMIKISRMTEEALRNVENFSIYNEFGRITFDSPTDLTGLDLDEIVVLGHRTVELYPDNGKVRLPEVGKGLNKAATIEFYKWNLPRKYQDNIEAYRSKLEHWAELQNSELVYFDPDREIVCIHVENFNLKD